MKKTFEATMTWAGKEESFQARIVVGDDGWGAVYEKATNTCCGSITPIQVILKRREVQNA